MCFIENKTEDISIQYNSLNRLRIELLTKFLSYRPFKEPFMCSLPKLCCSGTCSAHKR